MNMNQNNQNQMNMNQNNNQNNQMRFGNNYNNNQNNFNNQNNNNNNNQMMNNNNQNMNNNNQNMNNNNQNMNNNNQNMNNYNQNMNNMDNNNQAKNFKRTIYKTKVGDMSVMCAVQQYSELIDKNEVNEIKNIIQINYTAIGHDQKIILSDIISNQLKQKLQGEWFVFVSDVGKNVDFSISTVSKSGFLIIRIGNSQFIIAKIRN